MGFFVLIMRKMIASDELVVFSLITSHWQQVFGQGGLDR
ncbi:hypothetical protein L313_2374 [Acinetobacter haemolyticus CIP 64.3 = MTCC 9819]|nr:hypothetical protein L313_2374 [Acinetobacter haemolyticus CIP 64.3 = MTCC 9819]